MEALQENLQTHDLLGALQIQVHFCFTKPVEQSLLSRLTEAMLWIGKFTTTILRYRRSALTVQCVSS